MRRLTILGAAALAVAVVGTAAGAVKLTLKSSAFVNGAQLPVKYSCDGDNVSPPLAWTGVPKGTKELAVLVEDPDAPGGTFTHWITWGISPKVRGLGERKAGPIQGRSDGGRVGYAGACPPRGSPHRYVFRLYALKAKLGLARGATRAQFDRAIRGKVITRAQLVGLFARSESRFELSSTAFASGATIPAQLSCQGPSPPLQWTAPPTGTRSLALLVDDPDAPGGTFTHWITWGIPPTARGLGQGEAGSVQGRNDLGRVGWFGPCPPPGAPHRYVFRLYALEVELALPAAATRAQFLAAIGGQVLAEAELVGFFGR